MRGIPAEQLSAISKEVEQYKSALRECYKAHDASMVTFEVGRYSGKGGHAHVQVSDLLIRALAYADSIGTRSARFQTH